MTELKHTPGPWFITGRATLYVDARIPGGFIQEVAAVGPTEADGGYGDHQEANARLIAAAPELLDALQKLVADFESEIHNEYDGTSMLNARLAECDYARAAIAKATGGTL